jgi:hypothetical protein
MYIAYCILLNKQHLLYSLCCLCCGPCPDHRVLPLVEAVMAGCGGGGGGSFTAVYMK